MKLRRPTQRPGKRGDPRRVALLIVATLVLGACGLSLHGTEADDQDAAKTFDASLDVQTRDNEVGDAVADRTIDAPLESSASDASPDADGSADASHDAPLDAPRDACDAAVENCTNGIDDNCDGLVDCQDPECAMQGFVCAPAIPAGWSAVAFDELARPACPSGWGSSAPLVEGPDGGSSCPCTCGQPVANPCAVGTADMSLGQQSCGCAAVQNVPLASDGGCNAIGAHIGVPCGAWGDGKIGVLDAAVVSCGSTAVLPAVTFSGQGELCAPMESAGAGCAEAGACLPVTAPSSLCVAQTGVSICPAGFPHTYVVYSPSNVVDHRACGSCDCTSLATSCSSATATLYDDPACTKNPVVITADNGCDDFSGNPADAGWFTYRASPNTTACSGPSSAPFADGGIEVSSPITICCP